MYVINRLFRRLIIKSDLFKRNKHKDTHWSVQRKKVFAVDRALNHFDEFYKQVFGKEWPSIRQGLLEKQKYVAVINNYSVTEETVTKLENRGALNMRTLFSLEKDNIREQYAQKRRIQYLEKIWKAESTPKVENEQAVTTLEENKKKDYSLRASLGTAEYDTSRLLDENNAMSISALSHFLPATKIKGKDDWISESEHYKYYEKGNEMIVNMEKEYDIHFPEHLNVYCYEQDNYSSFSAPKRGVTEVYDYYLMDGGSVLPVLALDLKPGHKILDMCAAPGGKSLLALQTLYPSYLMCNDSSMSRTNRIFDVLKQYLYDLNEGWIKSNKISVTCYDGRFISEKDNFDRILVDVPCTTDRLSLKENDNNIFKPGRIKERLKLPELQCELLVTALKLVRKGGVVVYSTCSLSPIQNDGVVYMALKQIWEETNMKIVVRDLSPALAQVRNVYKLSDRCITKYGHLILPFKQQNYGPTYFCKLLKVN